MTADTPLVTLAVQIAASRGVDYFAPGKHRAHWRKLAGDQLAARGEFVDWPPANFTAWAIVCGWLRGLV